MKPAPFEYLRPRDLSELLAFLREGGPGAKLLAGGQSLGPMLNLRLARPSLLIDVSRVEELRFIQEKDDAWRFGAAVTHSRIEDANGQLRGAAMLAEVAAGIAYRGVRNRGTIGGSLAHADPAGDWPLALATLGAKITVKNTGNQTRSIDADDLITMAYTTRLKSDELIESITVPKLSLNGRYGYFKFCRKTGEFPEASAAAVFDPERRFARVFVGALTGAPRRLDRVAEAAARGRPGALTDELVENAIAAAESSLSPVARRLHAGCVFRAIQRAVGP